MNRYRGIAQAHIDGALEVLEAAAAQLRWARAGLDVAESLHEECAPGESHFSAIQRNLYAAGAAAKQVLDDAGLAWRAVERSGGG